METCFSATNLSRGTKARQAKRHFASLAGFELNRFATHRRTLSNPRTNLERRRRDFDRFRRTFTSVLRIRELVRNFGLPIFRFLPYPLTSIGTDRRGLVRNFGTPICRFLRNPRTSIGTDRRGLVRNFGLPICRFLRYPLNSIGTDRRGFFEISFPRIDPNPRPCADYPPLIFVVGNLVVRQLCGIRCSSTSPKQSFPINRDPGFFLSAHHPSRKDLVTLVCA